MRGERVREGGVGGRGEVIEGEGEGEEGGERREEGRRA